MNAVLLPILWAVVGAAAGWVMRWGSERLATLEELEPGHKAWQVYGPPIVCAILFGLFAIEPISFGLLAVRSVFVIVLVQVIFFDFEHRLILDRVMFPSMALALIVSLFHQPWWAGIATGLGAGGLFLLIALIGSAIFKAEALGFGDVKLALFMGLLLGPLPTIQALFYGVLLAGIVSIGYIIWRRSMKGTIAYGPYLAAGALTVLFQLGRGQ
ncbi:MAG TPA: A24 family peptidase [Candidatus Dormibacteraeota bacterium]|nr:A24 family peptidase [Candidatus Dormibacteraeota bacterium]